MREIDFNYGEALLLDIEKEAQDHFSNNMSREQEIKGYCDSLIQEGTVDSISRLMLLVFEHEVGKVVIDYTNWGCILRLALNILIKEKKKEDSIIFKVNNLDQLIYIFRTMRFLNYRWQLTKDEASRQNLEKLFDELNLSEVAREEIKKASLIQKEQ